MPLTTKFFQLINNRDFTAAERVLARIQGEVKDDEWGRGYINALGGLLFALKSSNSRYTFASKLVDVNSEEISKARKYFLKQMRSPFCADFDRGFFTVWAEYLRVLKKLKAEKTGNPT